METAINNQANDRTWQKVVMNYIQPDLRKSIWQICNSVIPYFILWVLMVQSLKVSYLLTLLLAIIASGFLVRIFIIFHDCGHGSFFKSKKANKIVGIISGIITFTPYYTWHKHHSEHHATTVNLDKRGLGDVWTMTVDEYLSASIWKRLLYRAFRNPYIMFTVGPFFMFVVQNRFSNKNMTPKERWNVYFTNIVLLGMATGMSLLIGLKAYLLIQLPLLWISHAIGLWLFYVQHQFEDVSWDRGSSWDYKTAAIQGSSFLKLPAVLQWFTGNIGFHHVHHLSPRIPNYNLARCQNENELFKDVKPITFLSTFKALKLSLWDEANGQLIRFRKISVTNQ
ncbi:MAG TPA: fatty acid desaturase [Prolixibacteraceae bacterium]